jgi:hypothetical protein
VARIVTTVYRHKRPPRKRKAVAIVGKRNKADAVPPTPAEDHTPPANDDRKPPPPGARKPAIVTTASRKRATLIRAEQAAEPNNPEADAAMRAWLERAKWGRGPG